jgi:hypothetical protein
MTMRIDPAIRFIFRATLEFSATSLAAYHNARIGVQAAAAGGT